MLSPTRSWHGHPLWLVGFRPFFLLATASAVVMPLSWVLLLAGVLTPPVGLSALAWHAHEMFFGFGFAVLGGFLLTATKNWVQVRGHCGHTLQGLAVAWLFERAGLWWGGNWPEGLQLASRYLFTVALVALLLWTLVRHRKTDSYRRDNLLFLVALPTFLAARWLLLSSTHFASGRDLTLALFRLALLVMLERTLVPFMKGAFQLALPRRPLLDGGIKLLGLSLLATPILPAAARAAIELVLALLLVGRMFTWSPGLAFQRLELGVMYAGMLALAGQLVLDALRGSWIGAMSVHVFTFGVMGLIIPAMLLRIAQGHTGRPIVFALREKSALWMMGVGFFARVVAPQLAPGLYTQWVWLAALGWSACFALVGLRITPMLLAERVDGREH